MKNDAIMYRLASTGCRISLYLLVCIVMGSESQASFADLSWPSNMKIISWSASDNDPAWNRVVTGTRIGCSSPPERCVSVVPSMAKSGISEVHFSFLLDRQKAVDYARQFSHFSRQYPAIVEVGFDDFVSQYARLIRATTPEAAEATLQAVVSNVSGENPNLKFGITLYETELGSPLIGNSAFPKSLRDQVGYVHLFILYRNDGPQFASFVDQAKRFFPNAQIIGGIYAYDRLDFVPCGPRLPKCSAAQALSLFSKTTEIEARLLNEGTLAAVEFYPGFLGRTGEWSGWRDPHNCAPGRLRECIQNTDEMRDRALGILRKTASKR